MSEKKSNNIQDGRKTNVRKLVDGGFRLLVSSYMDQIPAGKRCVYHLITLNIQKKTGFSCLSLTDDDMMSRQLLFFHVFCCFLTFMIHFYMDLIQRDV